MASNSLPEPPPNVPRIAEVQNPASGHYVVMVRMPTQLAAKFPDKPWGTSIAEIGLSKKDSDQYPGYTLVDVAPMKGSPDLYWIFQKLDGPVWTTKSKGQESLVPAKYKRLVTTTQTKQEVAPATLPDDPSAAQWLDPPTNTVPNPAYIADLKSSTVQQQEDAGKAIKVNTKETIAVDGAPIVGQQFDPGGAILDVSETLVPEGTSADAAFLTAQSTVEAFGDGDAAKVTQKPRRRKTDGTTEVGWPKKQKKSKGSENLTPQKYRGLITTSLTTEQVALEAAEVDDIPDPAIITNPEAEGYIANATVVEHEKVNDYRYEKRTTTEEIDVDGDPLEGQQTVTQFGGGVADTTEQLVVDGSPEAVVEEGLTVLGSSVVPLGNGKSVLQTTKLADDGFPLLRGQDYNVELGVSVPYEEQVVAAFEEGALPEASDVAPIDKWRSKVRTPDVAAIQSALDRIHFVLPTEESIRLPDVLRSVKVLVSRIKNDGNTIGAGFMSASGSSSVALSADLNYEIEEGFSGSVPAEVHVFFASEDNAQNAIFEICNASPWPLYRPVSHRIVMAGYGLSKHWSLAISDDGTSASEDADIKAFTTIGTIPATLHSGTSIEVEYIDYTAPTADLDVYTDRFLQRLNDRWEIVENACVVGGTVLGTYIKDTETQAQVLGYIQTIQEGINFRQDLSIEDFTVSVSPESLSGTDITEIRPGRYVVRSSASLYGYGRVRVTAVVVDLNELL